MKSLIMLAGLLVLASCSGGSSGGGAAGGANANQVRKGEAVSEQDLKEMLTTFDLKRKERGFQKKIPSTWDCDKEGTLVAEREETVTVISITGNARVERIETAGDSCEDGKIIHNFLEQEILISKEEEEEEVSQIDISYISNAKILNQELSFENTLEEDGEEIKVITTVDLATNCITGLSTLDGKVSYKPESSCKVVNIDSMNMKDDSILMKTQPRENGRGYSFLYLDDLSYSDIEDKNISIIKVPEYGETKRGYNNYISIK